jgi:hypothetical protein
VGTDAAPSDSAAAASLIDDLAKDFSGDSNKVKITYKKASEGGERINAVRSNNELNYGEELGTVTETSGFDDSDSDLLEDVRFDNDASDEDYEQTLTLKNGRFDYSLKDEVSGVDTIRDGIFYADGTEFAVYKLDLKTAITDTTQSKFIGKELTIMGNEFTIGDIQWSSGNLSKLVLLGGANKVSLGEGETSTVTVDGKSYEIEVLNVDTTSSTNKVLLSINGESRSIDEFDTEEVAGVNVAVTDLVGSGRDAVKGYAEVVIGGQKITLSDGGSLVEINEEDVDDLFPDYEVYSDFTGSGIDVITITYKVSDDVLLEAGESLTDVLFQSFSVEFDGTNDPEYSTIELRVNDDDLKITGTTEDGVEFNRDLLHMGDKLDSTTAVWLKGDGDEDRIFFQDSIDLTGATGTTSLVFKDGTNPVLNLSQTNVKGSGILIERDNDEQYLYEISTVDTTGADAEVDLDEFLRGDDEENIKRTEWNTDLGFVDNFVSNTTKETFTIDPSKLGDLIAFENEVLLDLSNVETANITASAPVLTFTLDQADVDADEVNDEQGTLNITLGYDATDDEFNIQTITLSDVTNGNDNDNAKGDSDVKTYVNPYGIKVEHDNDEKTWAKIMVPEEQVRANVYLTFGETSQTMTKTVDADSVESVKAELEEEGYTIVGTEEVASESVEFNVEEAVLDSEAGSSNLIVIGGPAVNAAARALLGIETYTVDQAGVNPGEGIARYFEDSNSVLIYGYSAEDTTAIVAKVNEGTANFQ